MRIRKRSVNSFSFSNVPVSSSHFNQTIMAAGNLLQLKKRSSSSHVVQAAEKKLGADDDQVQCHRRGEDHHHHHHHDQLEVHDHDTRGRISRSTVDLMSSDLPAPENGKFRRGKKGGGIENSSCMSTFGGRSNYGESKEDVGEKSMTKKTERSSDDQGSWNQLGSLGEKLIVPSSTTTTSRSDANIQSHEDGSWNEGERAFPLKKKRRNLNWPVSNISSTDHHDHDAVVHEHDHDADAEAEANNGFNESDGERINKLINKKGKKLGKVMSIGSGDDSSKKDWKCSRMNGRGWRCNKPTLVGYSLCEHHLGKGRRRMKTITVNLTPENATSSNDYHIHQHHKANKKFVSKTVSTSLNGVKCRSINNILHTRYQDNN